MEELTASIDQMKPTVVSITAPFFTCRLQADCHEFQVSISCPHSKFLPVWVPPSSSDLSSGRV